MKSLRIITLLAAIFLLIALAGCGAPNPPAKPPGGGQPPAAKPTEEPEPAAEPTAGMAAQEPLFADFDPGNFDDPTVIDNEWMPMRPGTQWVYEGTSLDDEGEEIARRIEFTITDLTKEVAGVRTVVAWIVDYNDEEVVEKEIAFYAQDKDGTVWYLGEHPEEIEGGKFIQAPTWIAGIQDARPGIKMMAKPELGKPPVYQGWGPAVEWSDFGRVDQMGIETCVLVDCFPEVLVNVESSLGETNAYQLKYFARGVGEVRVDWKGEDQNQEVLELVEYSQLDTAALAKIRAQALALEKHAYEVSAEVYGPTPPME
jgi:hypothetical protein